ncbi:MAG: branched-chain amino acid ABC transporter substrate-binding protein [Actinomycetota bacterium]|nr:branched-chain amino acid ABC transporter substrate-binding protein [Actinomycetota bacterium]
MSRMTRGGWRVIALLVLSSLVLAACGDDDDEETTTGGQGGQTTQTATIGFVGALTGDNANLGINIRDGMRVAIDEENAKGGTQITMKEFDTAGDPAQASTIKDRFIGDQSVIGIVGPAFSGETRAVLPDIEAGALPMISASATNKELPSVVPNGKVFHRIIADDALQANGIVSYLTSLNPRPRSVAFIHDNTEYGKGLTDDVQRLATGKGLTNALSATVDPKAQDFSATVNAVRSANPSHIFYGGYYAEAGRLRKQLVDAGVTAEFISGDGSLDPGFITAAGASAAENAKLSCPCNLALEASTGNLKAFYDSFKSKIGKEPGLYSPEAYDAAKILIQGIKAGNTDRAKLLNYLEGFTTYEGFSKSISFEPNGNLQSKTFFVFQVRNGKIAPGQQIEATG